MAHKSIYDQRAERKAKGRAIALPGDVLEVMGGWTVLGDSGRVYFLTFRYATHAQPALYDCTCRDYERRQDTCKHGYAVEETRLQQAARMDAAFGLASYSITLPVLPVVEMAVAA
jgi:hypothetical protein